MKRHLEQKHPYLTLIPASAKATNMIQSTIIQDNQTNSLEITPAPTRVSHKQQQIYDQALVEMILSDLIPLSCVEKEGLQRFVAVLRPGYVLPSRPALNEMISQSFKSSTQELIQFCHKHAKYPSYTTDLWKSEAKQYYLSIALHFVDENWKLQSPLIATCHVTGIIHFTCYLLVNLLR
jgi:hypothetical protein